MEAYGSVTYRRPDVGRPQPPMEKMIGYADLCELMAAAFAFPDERLAGALADRSFLEDARSCLSDAGADEEDIEEVCVGLGVFLERDRDDLLASLKRGYSSLFLKPGPEKPVWPYESAFRHVADGKEGAPILFRSPVTVDVENMMRDAGVLPGNARTEPSDSIWNEFSYLSYLYGKAAEACYGGHLDEADGWLRHVDVFVGAHAGVWVSSFMAEVVVESQENPYGRDYGPLGNLGLVVERCSGLVGTLDGSSR